MEWSARFAAVLLLRHLAIVEFSENRDRLFGPVEPINTNAVIGIGVFRDLEYALNRCAFGPGMIAQSALTK